MTERPKLAHALLADAVRALLDNTNSDPFEVSRRVDHLTMSLRNYDLAVAAAEAAPFERIVSGAIAQLDAGDTESAKKFLLTLLAVVDFSPNIALGEVVRPPAPADEFTPTNRHVDGGLYQYLGDGWHKSDSTGDWIHAAFYRGDDLVMRSTTMTRWHERFDLIEAPADAEA